MKNVVFLIFTLMVHFASSQDFSNYTSLKCEGNIPEDFTTLSSKKFESSKRSISKNDDRRTRKAKETFYLESSFGIDEMLQSGLILFNDTVSRYVNRVADELLKKDPDLRKKIRIYTMKSAKVNAFTTPGGIIFICTGLIARLNNEAELAFILSHEIVHYQKHHSMKQYIKDKEIEKGKGIYKRLDYDESQLESYKFSKSQELDADKGGWSIFEKSSYSKTIVNSTMDLLLYSYLPYNNREVPFSMFEEHNYSFPKGYFPDSIKSISAEDDYDDDYYTHPNIKTRRTALHNQVKDSTSGSLFILNEEDFIQVKKICRYENCVQLLRTNRYPEAIYDANLLIHDYGESYFLNMIIAKGLYGIAKYKNYEAYDDIAYDFEKSAGYMYETAYFFYMIPRIEANVLALRYVADMKSDFPGDLSLNAMYTGLVSDLVNLNDLSAEDFFLEFKEIPDSGIVKADTIPRQKTKKLKGVDTREFTYAYSKPVKLQGDQSNDYYKYAFVNLFAKTDLKKDLENSKTIKQDELSKKEVRKLQKKERHEEKYGISLGLDKVLFISPFYAKWTNLRKVHQQYIASEEAKINLVNKIRHSANEVHLDYELLDGKLLGITDTEKFNDLAIIKTWLSEKLRHDDMGMEASNTTDFRKVMLKYGTENLCFMGVAGIKEKHTGRGAILALTILFYPMLPYGIYYFFHPANYTYFLTLVADANTGEFKMKYLNFVRASDSNSIQNSNIYYIMQQIKRQPE